MQTAELVLTLLLIADVGGALVRWTSLGLPIFLVVCGVLASLLPGLDAVHMDPEARLRKTRPDYVAYIEQTSGFIPWPPRKPSA